jgi:hypothetical protein
MPADTETKSADRQRLTPPTTDFFRSQFGNYVDLPFWRRRSMGRLMDPLFDLRLQLNSSYRALRQASLPHQPLKVLILGVEVPARSADLKRVLSTLAQSRHDVTCISAALAEGCGKFQNINHALQQFHLDDFDWLIIVDDDVDLPTNFLDTFLYLAEQEDLKICMPAHCFHSYQGYAVTQRHWNSLARITHFVECGPLTAFHRDCFPLCLPFPDLRWAWGTDVVWSESARDHRYRIGIVDACPLQHLRPIAGSYDNIAAREEAELFLQSRGVSRSRSEILETVSTVRTLRS